MSTNARRSTCREGYRIYWEGRNLGLNPTLGWINDLMHLEGVYEDDEPDVTERSAHHWPDYYDEGIHPADYPALNRWEIARSAIPPEFQDAT